MSGTEQKEEWEKETKGRRIRPGMAVFYSLLLLLILGGVFWLFFRQRGNYTEAQIERSYDIYPAGGSKIQAFGRHFLKYSADGASLLQDNGQELWNITYSMNNPRLIQQGDYGILADLSGQSVVIFDKNGESGRFETTDPILSAAVSAKGVTAVTLERDLNSLVRFYDASGRELDIEISLEMSVSGYPMAMAISPDGSGLVLAMVSSQSGTLNSQLVFYNFGVGRSQTNRLIGFFNHEGRLLTQIDYISPKRVAAVLDDRLEIYSLEQENKPELSETILFPGEITAYASGNGHEAFLCPEAGSGDLKLYVYDANGKHCFTQSLRDGGSGLTLGKELVLLQTEGGVELFTYGGKSYFSGLLPRQNASLFLEGKRLIQFDGANIHHYRFR